MNSTMNTALGREIGANMSSRPMPLAMMIENMIDRTAAPMRVDGIVGCTIAGAIPPRNARSRIQGAVVFHLCVVVIGM